MQLTSYILILDNFVLAIAHQFLAIYYALEAPVIAAYQYFSVNRDFIKANHFHSLQSKQVRKSFGSLPSKLTLIFDLDGDILHHLQKSTPLKVFLFHL